MAISAEHLHGSDENPPAGPGAVADTILDHYRRLGGDRYDEVVTQNQHALQCATLAERAGSPESLVAASLLHDLGHLLGDRPDGPRGTDRRHEVAAAAYLSQWFDEAVTRPVALHVAAKRYLCAVDADYAATLSPASVASLAVQGGPFETAQVEAFEALSGWRDAVRLRRWDDQAKEVGVRTRSLEEYRDLLVDLVRR